MLTEGQFERVPENLELVLGLSDFYRGFPLKGILYLTAAVEAEPGNGTYTWYLGLMHLSQGNDDEAVKWLEKTVELAPEQVLPFGQELLAPHGLILANIGSATRPLWLLESRAKPTVLRTRTLFVAPENVARHQDDHTPITTVIKLKHVRLAAVQNEMIEAWKKTGDANTALIPVAAEELLRGLAEVAGR